MRCRFSFFTGLAMVIGAFVASQDLFGESSDDSLFTDTIQASLPLGLEEPSDLTDLTGDQKFLAYDDPGLLSDGSSILPPENPTTYSPDEFFSISSDPFVPADCFGFDSSSLSSIPIAMGRLRSKRSGQCAAPNNINNAVPSVPTVDDLDENVRETILRVYPALGDELRLSQEDDDDNSACVLLSGGVMPRGACTSATHWMYFGSGTFSWNSQYKLKLWDLWYVTPVYLKQAMGCPDPRQAFLCCKEISIVAGLVMGLECAFLFDLIQSWLNHDI